MSESLIPIGGTMIWQGNYHKVQAHVLASDGKLAELPGVYIGPAPKNAANKLASKAPVPMRPVTPGQPIRQPRTRIYRPRPKQFQPKPRPIVYQRAPLTTGELWFLVIAAGLFALGYMAMCVHDKQVLSDKSEKAAAAASHAMGK